MPHQQRKQDCRKTEMLSSKQYCVFLIVRGSFRLGSGSDTQSLGETCPVRHICNYPDPLKNSFNRPMFCAYTKWQSFLAVHTCRQIFYARGSVLHMVVDKTCLVEGHHCGHARTREGSAAHKAISWLL